MRELTLDELNIVAGGMQQSSDMGGVAIDPGGQSPTDTGGQPSSGAGGATGSASHWQGTLNTLQSYFDHMDSNLRTVGEYSGSQYDHDMGDDWGKFEAYLYDHDGYRFPSHDPAAQAQDYLWSDIDPEIGSGAIGGGIFGNLAGNTISASDGKQSNEGIFEVGGLMLQTIYHSGAPTTNDGNTVVVNGGYFEVIPIGMAPSGYTPTPNSPIFNPDASLPYVTQGVTPAANAFASLHVRNEGTTDADKAWYERAHDNMAKLYDYASQHPNESITIGSGVRIPMSKVFGDILHTNFVITDNDNLTYNPGTGHNEGAVTSGVANPNDPMSHTIFIDPQNSKMQNYGPFGETGMDYIFFHELGHSLNFQELTGNSGREDNANSAARSIERLMGIPIIDTKTLNNQPPNGGYND